MRLISLSVFGHDVRYAAGALENAEIAPRVYPGWTLRVYTEMGHPVIPLLSERGVDVVEVEGTTGNLDLRYWHTLTRFAAAADPGAEHIVFRDADSRLNVREAAAVGEWLQSGRALHVMRDHPRHDLPMLAGMWGIRGGRLKRIREWMVPWRERAAQRGVDQAFLAEVIYPAFAAADRCEHGTGTSYPGNPFPPHPPYEGFVGEVIAPGEAAAALVRAAMRRKRPRRSVRLRFAELDDEILLYDPARRATIRLNESAATVWHLCDGSRSLGELIGLVGAAYPDDSAVGAELETVVHQLARDGVIELA